MCRLCGCFVGVYKIVFVWLLGMRRVFCIGLRLYLCSIIFNPLNQLLMHSQNLQSVVRLLLCSVFMLFGSVLHFVEQYSDEMKTITILLGFLTAPMLFYRELRRFLRSFK